MPRVLLGCTIVCLMWFNTIALGSLPDTTGSAYVEHYIAPDEWHGYCLPVQSATTSPFNSIFLTMKWWEEPTHHWRSLTDTTGDSLLASPIKGYLVYASSQLTQNTTVGVEGHLNTGYMLLNLTATAAPGHLDGLNLIGNPYPSALNWYMVGLNNVDPTLYIYSSLWHNYIYFNRFLNMHSSLCQWAVPQAQSFFVHVSTPGPSTGQISVNNTCRLHAPGQVYLDNPGYSDLLEITVTGNGRKDEAHILFLDTASLGFDSQLDALKIPGDPDAPQIWSRIGGGVNAALNCRPWTGPCSTVDLGFTIGVGSVDTLVFSGLTSFADSLEIWLQDKKENYYQLLRPDPDYIFTAAPGDDSARFVVWFCNPFTGIGVRYGAGYRIWGFEEKLYVDLTKATGQQGNKGTGQQGNKAQGQWVMLSLFDLAGRKVLITQLPDGQLSILTPGLVQGYYIARLEDNNGATAVKVFLH